MSIRCNKCENKVFDSNAYLKISEMERDQQEKVNQLAKKIKGLKSTDEQSHEAVLLIAEKMVLQAIQQCKNVL
ncbi:hypothetical protein H9L25_00415 [Terrisporobacter mayombei]|nr:hypothetical protein [Terrisporobacter mayombei]